MQEKIKITIPYTAGEEFNFKKYTDPKNCYIAEQLKIRGFKKVMVGGFGIVFIGNTIYRAEEVDICKNIRLAFKNKQDLNITLIKQ